MKVANIAAPVARKLGWVAKKVPLAMGTAILAGGMVFCGSAQAETVLIQDFEGLTLTPGNPSYTDVIPGWTRDNSGMLAPSNNLAYDGGTAMNIEEWIAQQGAQLGRNQAPGGPYLTGQNALVFDCDAWDDDPGGVALGFNSYWSTDVDLSGIDRNRTNLVFDYEFASYDSQRGLAQVSFDGGANWDTLLDLDSDVLGNSVLLGESVSYSAGVDFTPTSDTMTLRFGLIDADNDWWYAVDNILVADTELDPTLFLEVDTANGNATINNGTGQPVDIDYYEILSASGSLSETGWDSLQDQDLPGFPAGDGTGNGWEEAGGSGPNVLSESFLTGSSVVADQESVGLGNVFDASAGGGSGEQDLVFRYGLAGGGLVGGFVEYVVSPFDQADFDQDGDVDGDDFLLWQGGFGTPSGAEKMDGDYDNDGDVDGDDFLGWQAEFGNSGGNASAVVPEPSTLGLFTLILTGLGFSTIRRSKKEDVV